MERGQWEKSGCCNYDSATPLLHWLKLHKKRQMRPKGKCQKHTPLKMASSQQRRAILNAGWPTALGSGDFSRLWSKIIGGKKGCVYDKTGATPFFIGHVQNSYV
jgi:hypothetical protein